MELTTGIDLVRIKRGTAQTLDKFDEFSENRESRMVRGEGSSDTNSDFDTDASNHTSQSEEQEENGVHSGRARRSHFIVIFESFFHRVEIRFD